MTHTTAAEDRATESIESNATLLVDAIRRLDSELEERDARIEDLKQQIKELEAKVEELESGQG